MTARTTYWMRCGWCGAYQGTVSPSEPCATDPGTGEYSGPHQFQVSEEVHWRPISEAPKDGRRIMLYSPDARERDAVWTGYWQDDPGLEGLGAWWESEEDPFSVDAVPSHWMELPEPPDE